MNNLGQGTLGDDKRITCEVDDASTIVTGTVVSLDSGTTARKIKVFDAAAGAYGVVFDVNEKMNSCVVTIEGSGIAARSFSGIVLGQGLVNPSGYFANAGTATNFTVVAGDLSAINGNTGEVVEDCCLVDVGFARAAAPNTATVEAATTTTKKGAK